jgi:Domain of unknown function (DUF4124)
MLRTLAISSLLFVGAVSVAHADVFRWVDDHGGVHYSDQWVPGSEVIKSTRPRPASASSDSPRSPSGAQKSTSLQAAGQGTQSAEKAVKQDMAKVREQQCKEAKDRYDKAIEARRIYKTSEGDKSKASPDDRQYLSDDEADAYRVKARQEVEDLCGKSAK